MAQIFALSLFVWPLIFVNIFIVAGLDISEKWELVYILLSAVFSGLFAYNILEESIESFGQLIFGLILFGISYIFLARIALRSLIINSVEAMGLFGLEYSTIGLTTYYGQLFLTYILPLLLLTLFVFPLFSWLTLVDLDKEDSIILFQRYTERALEGFTSGNKFRALFLYIIIFGGGLYLNLLYFTSILPIGRNGFLLSVIFSLLVMALLLPLLNTAFVTAEGYVNSIRKNTTDHTLTGIHRIYRQYLVPAVALVLLLAVIGGLILQIRTVMIKSNAGTNEDTFEVIGMLSITAKLILGGLGSLSMTAKIWEEIEDGGRRYNPISFYPVYIFSALLLTIGVEFMLLNLEVSELLVSANLPLVLLFLVEKIMILLGVIVVYRASFENKITSEMSLPQQSS